MPEVKTSLSQLAADLQTHPAILEKAQIHRAYAPAVELTGSSRIGDDCAAIPDPVSGGHLLFASEGMLDSFVAEDPWFAGYSAVMVNLSDVAAMGGRPIAITNTLWTPDQTGTNEIWLGMRAASIAYGVPVVGGHTTKTKHDKAVTLGASVLGRAGQHLLTSFDAKPDDHLVIVIDMQGAYRKDKPFWNASTTSNAEKLQNNLELLASLAETKWCAAAKDISNGGIIGTLAMFCNCSEVGAEVVLDKLPRPVGTDWLKWLVSFPSYGYLLAVKDENLNAVTSHFCPHGITVASFGRFTATQGISLSLEGNSETLKL